MPKVVPQYKEQARKRIIKAATAEFAKKGYRNVTMNDIAEKVGVSKAALYHYFNSKQSLVAAIAASLLESAVEGEISRREDQSFLEAAEGSFGRLLKSMPGLLPGLPFEVIAEAQRDRGARDTSVGLESALAEALSKSWDTCRGEWGMPSDPDATRLVRGLLALQLGLLAEVSAGIPRQQANEAWVEVVRRVVVSFDVRQK